MQVNSLRARPRSVEATRRQGKKMHKRKLKGGLKFV